MYSNYFIFSDIKQHFRCFNNNYKILLTNKLNSLKKLSQNDLYMYFLKIPE